MGTDAPALAMLISCLLLASCSADDSMNPPPPPTAARAVAPAMQAHDVLATAHRLASRERTLAARLDRRGWSAGGDGITSTGWGSGIRTGREAIASRLPARADGAWETRIAGAEQLKIALHAEGAQPTPAELIDGRVIYRDAYPATHALFSVDAHEAELNFVLVDARAPREFTFGIESEGGALQAHQDSEQRIAFLDRAGQTRLVLGTPQAIDAVGVTRNGTLILDGERVHMRLDPTGLTYPIVFDPPLGTPTWTQLSPTTSPAARTYYGMATLGTKVVMFGGRLSTGINTDETWEWDGINWSLKSPANKPSARQPWQQMATLGSNVVLFSGAGPLSADTWIWTGTNWTQLSPSTSPTARGGGHLAELLGSLYLFGGTDSSGNDLEDTWQWNGTNWDPVSGVASENTFPSARSLASVTSFDGQIVMFGGSTATGSSSDETWTFDGGTWEKLAPSVSPPARIRAAMVSLGNSVVLFGGQGNSRLADTWGWDGTTWTQASPLTAPIGRAGAQFALLNGNAVLFGGFYSGDYFSDTWKYTLVPLAVNGVVCTAAAQCASGVCVDGVCCNVACSGGTLDCQSCNVSGSAGACTLLGSSTTCRTSTGDCDSAEVCDGSSPTCPGDARLALGTSCRSSIGVCDPAEVCDGESATCPTDARSPNDSACTDDSNVCTRDVCNGSLATCTHPAGNATMVCRGSVDKCDAVELCTGSESACPSDSKLSAATVCRESDGDCDVSETCDGSSNECPTDVFANTSVLCRVSVGGCDVSDYCTGLSATCSADVVTTTGTPCRPVEDECDVAEVCDGTAVECPSDQFKVTGVTCSNDDNPCTIDVCSGNDATCTHHGGNSGTVCREVDGLCDVAELCTGDSKNCPTDAYLTPGTSCRDASCDAGEQVRAAICSGASPNCPTAVPESCGGFTCDSLACFTSCASGTQCAAGYYCDGSECQADLELGTACTSANQCGSENCIDGVCCDSTCTGQCEACDVASAPGTCSAVNGEPHGTRDICDTDGTSCAGSCDGTTRALCTYAGAEKTCRDASCEAGIATLVAHCGGDGTCGPRIDVPCTPFFCDPVLTECAGDCLSEGDCVEGFFCFAGVCKEKHVLGTPCSGEQQCVSGSCVDDVCCDTDCDQQCEACDLSGAEGTCSPVMGEPHSARTPCASDTSACEGACNGTLVTACSYPDSGTNCRLGSCSAGTATVAAFCDGSGSCPEIEHNPCELYICVADGCRGDCGQDTDCVSGSFCFGSVCTPKRALAAACSAANACTSGFCVDGVCCNGACNNQCEACDLAGNAGACLAVTGGPHGERAPCDTDGSACGGACDGEDRVGCAYPGDEITCRDASCLDGVATLTADCTGTGSCPEAQEQVCTPYRCGPTTCAGDCLTTSDCQTGFYCSAGMCRAQLAQGEVCGASEQCQGEQCVDGYCCNAVCDGQCEACGLLNLHGVCSAVTGTPRAGRAACGGSGTCAGRCDGVETRACSYPGDAVTCTAASCSARIATRAATCDGDGNCQTAVHRECTPYECGQDDCQTSCRANSECAGDLVCRDGQCAPVGEPDAGTSTEPDASTSEPDAGLDGGSSIEPTLDSDGDGIPDLGEFGADGESIDTDRDGIPNQFDEDDDGDSIPTRIERGRNKAQSDLDHDGIPNYLDTDGDGDGIKDVDEAKGDSDGDGIPDYKDKEEVQVGGSNLCSVREPRPGNSSPLWVVLGMLLWSFARRRRTQVGNVERSWRSQL